MLPSETMIWQPEFTDKTLSRKTGAVQPGEAAVLWVKRGDVEAMQKARNRASYLVKYETKQHDGSGQRNYGCSRGPGRLLDGR
ncbi:inovirus Gp2 family protein [Escherichia coli]|nr:inovirus Gp2 family protein [Escherichia coli]